MMNQLSQTLTLVLTEAQIERTWIEATIIYCYVYVFGLKSYLAAKAVNVQLRSLFPVGKG